MNTPSTALLASQHEFETIHKRISAANGTPPEIVEELFDLSRKELGLRCTCITLENLLARELPEPEVILAPWLTRQGVYMLYAWRGLGKSWFAMMVGYAAAVGGDFLKWKASRKWRVLYIDGELPARTLQTRLALIAGSFNGEPDPDSFRIITPDMQPDGLMPNLSEPSGQAVIDEYANNADLIIVDNLSTLARSGKENEGESWLPVQGWALKHRAQGRAVLFIHHSGKNGQQRGASRREDILDAVITLKRPAEYQSSEGARFEVIFEKARHLTGEDAEPIDATLISDGETIRWDWKPAEDSMIERIEALVDEGANRHEIMAETGLSRYALKRLVDSANERRVKKITLPDSRKGGPK